MSPLSSYPLSFPFILLPFILFYPFILYPSFMLKEHGL